MESLVSDLRKSVAKNLEASGSFRRMLKSNSTESSKADKLEAKGRLDTFFGVDWKLFEYC